MNCPLIQPKIEHEKGEEMVRMGRCTQEECAWWGNNSQQCVMNKLGAELYVIGEVLEEIRDKIPHEKKGAD